MLKKCKFREAPRAQRVKSSLTTCHKSIPDPLEADNDSKWKIVRHGGPRTLLSQRKLFDWASVFLYVCLCEWKRGKRGRVKGKESVRERGRKSEREGEREQRERKTLPFFKKIKIRPSWSVSAIYRGFFKCDRSRSLYQVNSFLLLCAFLVYRKLPVCVVMVDMEAAIII